jgi:hypothetical protein
MFLEAFSKALVHYEIEHALDSDGDVLIDEDGDLVLRMRDFTDEDPDDWTITPGEARVLAARLLRGAARYELQERAAGRPLDLDRSEERQAAAAQRERTEEYAAERAEQHERAVTLFRTSWRNTQVIMGGMPRRPAVIRDLIIAALVHEGLDLSVDQANELIVQDGF